MQYIRSQFPYPASPISELGSSTAGFTTPASRIRPMAAIVASIALVAWVSDVRADQVFETDVIVHNSLCVGFDCINNEDFGSDTIRLKENNLRIHFDDTSGTTFPKNDWRIIINDTASGGSSHFSIEDVTGSKTPFRVEAGARTDALVVDSSGRIGLGTKSPSTDLHITDSDTPTHRLEQNGSGGFTPQTWDIAGNEANFFVRDVTGGSTLPFRIRPGAPTSSIDINSTGKVGMGTASPSANLHVKSTSAEVTTLLESTADDASAIVRAAQTGSVQIESSAIAVGKWALEVQPASGGFFLRQVGQGVIPFRVLSNAPSNSLTVNSSGNVGLGVASPSANLHVAGTVRLAGLPNCADGLSTDASGNVSCLAAPSPARARALAPGAQAGSTRGSKSAAATTSGVSAAAGNTGGNANGKLREDCDTTSITGRWSLTGARLESTSAAGMLWCDAQLVATAGEATALSVTGACRHHGAGKGALRSGELTGRVAILEAGTCKISGALRIDLSGSAPIDVEIVEGRLETTLADGVQTRGTAIARLTRGGSVSVQAISLQR